MKRLILPAILLASSVASAGNDPALAEVLARAGKENKPVLLEFGAVWCGPCARMERDVFPKSEMQDALRGYIFQRYDSEVGEGLKAAEQFKVMQYPTLIVVSPGGDEVGRPPEQDPAGLAKRLIDLQPVAMVGKIDENTKDPQRLLMAAELSRSRGDGARAVELYRRAEAADLDGKAGVAAAAAFARLRVETSEAEARAHAELLLAFAERFPGSFEAVRAVEGLAALPERARPSVARIEAAAAAATDALAAASAKSELNQLIYALIALGLNDKAVRAGEALLKLGPDEPDTIDTAAEAYFQSGNRDHALVLEARALAVHPQDKGLLANQERFATGKPGATGPDAQDPLARERESGATDPRMRARYNAEAALSHRVVERCKDLAAKEKVSNPEVRVYLRNRMVTRVVVLDPELPKSVHACLEKALLGAADVDVELRERATVMIKFPPQSF